VKQTWVLGSSRSAEGENEKPARPMLVRP